MGRPRKTEHEKLVTISATVVPSLEETIKKLAKQNHWSPSRTAGILIAKALEREGLPATQNGDAISPLEAGDEGVGIIGIEQVATI